MTSQKDRQAARALYDEYERRCSEAEALPEGKLRSEAFRTAEELRRQYLSHPGAAKVAKVSLRQDLIDEITAVVRVDSKLLPTRERQRWCNWIQSPEPKPNLPGTSHPELKKLCNEWLLDECPANNRILSEDEIAEARALEEQWASHRLAGGKSRNFPAYQRLCYLRRKMKQVSK